MEDYKKATIESYDKHTQYHVDRFKWSLDLTRRKWEFETFLKLVKGKEVLDIGCGQGDHAKYLQEEGCNVTCIDLSQEMIKRCKEKGLNAQVMDIEQLDFPSERFDGAWANTSLLHLKKESLPPVLQKIKAILRDKGIFYICVKEGEGEGFVNDKEGNTKRFFSFYSIEELNHMLTKNGFRALEQQKQTYKGRTFIMAFFQKL